VGGFFEKLVGLFAKLVNKFNLLVLSALAKLALSRPSIRPSFRTEPLDYQRKEFDEISYLRLFRKSVEKFQVSLQFDKNNG
jgi:hypothetical protein